MSRPKGGEGASDCVSDVLGEQCLTLYGVASCRVLPLVKLCVYNHLQTKSIS